MTEQSPRDFFSRHAAEYARSASHASGEDLSLLIELLRLRGDESALDVATGTGFTALRLAESVRSVQAVDFTTEMISEARNLASSRKVGNVGFCLATADSLPFRVGSFDVVTCRRAAHHFRGVVPFLEEATRVLRRGARIGLADMSPIAGAEEFLNKIERIRDESHTKALTEREWLESFSRAGVTVASAMTVSAYVEFEKWLSPVRPGGKQEEEIRREFDEAGVDIRARLGVKFAGKRLLGYTKTWIVVVGMTP